jgi:hypothetical protein
VRTITNIIKAELPFGAVAAACPSAPALLWQHVWAPAPQQKPSGKFGFGGELGGSEPGGSGFTATGVSGGSEFGTTGVFGAVNGLAPISGSVTVRQLTTANIAGPATAGSTDLYRPFYAMSRRDPRAWRPPTD